MSTWNCKKHQANAAPSEMINPCPYCKIAKLEAELDALKDDYAVVCKACEDQGDLIVKLGAERDAAADKLVALGRKYSDGFPMESELLKVAAELREGEG